MKTALSIITLVIAVVALALSVHTRLNLHPRLDLGAETPRDVVAKYLSAIANSKVVASNAYWASHYEEIMKSLEIADFSESGNYGIVFFRFSIGSDIFRGAIWVYKVNGKWYRSSDPYSFLGPKPTDKEWVEKMQAKKEEWEKNSAKPEFPSFW